MLNAFYQTHMTDFTLCDIKLISKNMISILVLYGFVLGLLDNLVDVKLECGEQNVVPGLEVRVTSIRVDTELGVILHINGLH